MSYLYCWRGGYRGYQNCGHKVVWKGTLPLKIKSFLWLSLENKIFTQANYQKRERTIVNCCSLCGAALETMDHLLVICSFTVLVWWKIISSLHLDSIWGNGTFSNSLQIWFKNYKKYSFKIVVGLVSWNTWKIRNLVFFEVSTKSADVVVERFLKAFKELGFDPSKLAKSLKRGPFFFS